MLRNRVFTAVVGGHFMVDVLNSVGAVLLAVLAGPLGLSNQQIGLALTVYTLLGALSQPLFGWIADRLPGRTLQLAALGVVWMALCYTGVALAPNWTVLLPCFLLAALGSGLFHPIGTASAAAAVPDKPASATAIFFFGGQAGLAVGPILAGIVLAAAGTPGIVPVALAAIVPAGVLLLAQQTARSRRTARAAAPAAPQVWTALAIAVLLAFVALVVVRSSIQAVYQSFLPKLFSDRGWEPTVYGALAGTFMATAAVGNVLNGWMADRFGMRAATVWPLILSVPAGLACFLATPLWAIFIACGLAGMLVGGQHSILVVHAQRILPVKQGLASGLILGFTFATGAIGTWLSGILADAVGLETVMIGVTLLGLPAAALALTLPGRARPAAAPAAAPTPAAAPAPAQGD
ncbi:MFS transporter [Chloroflexus islandicus]|uniref:MFS transporter n=1 Tax=Chloroflexus islandicus TaxID=1707952 RepID=A0A178M3G3_9CHLR|nr:MFS transporter [Chloroflexus islandicus]OAN42687.1 MFS transporter [Chloroflexus islandicus]